MEGKRKYTFGGIALAIAKSAAFVGFWITVCSAVATLVAALLNTYHSGSSVEAIQGLYDQKSPEISVISNAITIILFALFYKIRKIPFEERCKIKPRRVSTYLYALGLGASSQLCILLALSLLMQIIPADWFDKLNETNSSIVNAPIPIMLAATVITAPLLEEIMCRALMLGAMKKAMPKWVAIVLSSFIFGLLHANPIGIIYATLFGILLGWLFVKTDSVLPSILCHLSFNLSSFIIGEKGVGATLLIMSIPLTVIFIKNIAKTRETE